MNCDSEDSEFTLDLTFEKGDFFQLCVRLLSNFQLLKNSTSNSMIFSNFRNLVFDQVILFFSRSDESGDVKKCSYVECGPLQGFCGASCFSGAKMCCEGTTYAPIQGYECCGSQYIAGRNAADDVCCGGQFHTRKDNYQCCGERYTHCYLIYISLCDLYIAM